MILFYDPGLGFIHSSEKNYQNHGRFLKKGGGRGAMTCYGISSFKNNTNAYTPDKYVAWVFGSGELKWVN